MPICEGGVVGVAGVVVCVGDVGVVEWVAIRAVVGVAVGLCAGAIPIFCESASQVSPLPATAASPTIPTKTARRD